MHARSSLSYPSKHTPDNHVRSPKTLLCRHSGIVQWVARGAPQIMLLIGVIIFALIVYLMLPPMAVSLSTRTGGELEEVCITMAVNIEYGALAVFVRSFRRVTANTARLILFVGSDLSFEDQTLFEDNNVAMVFQAVEKMSVQNLNSRWIVIKTFLDNMDFAPESRIILVDKPAEVVFQANPFALMPAGEEGLWISLENNKALMMTENSRVWTTIQQCYGDAIARKLALKACSCEAITMGTPTAIYSYVGRMAHLIATHASCEQEGSSQSAHNIAIWADRSTDLHILKPGGTAIAHLHGFQWVEIDMMHTRNGVVERNGAPVTIIHRYDHRLDFRILFRDKYTV